MVVKYRSSKPNCRVITYIDGFNLYFGLREKNWRKYMWLDVAEFSQALLLDNQALQQTKYFTSRVRGNVGKARTTERISRCSHDVERCDHLLGAIPAG